MTWCKTGTPGRSLTLLSRITIYLVFIAIVLFTGVVDPITRIKNPGSEWAPVNHTPLPAQAIDG